MKPFYADLDTAYEPAFDGLDPLIAEARKTISAGISSAFKELVADMDVWIGTADSDNARCPDGGPYIAIAWDEYERCAYYSIADLINEWADGRVSRSQTRPPAIFIDDNDDFLRAIAAIKEQIARIETLIKPGSYLDPEG